jgi:acetamidase/formamidase
MHLKRVLLAVLSLQCLAAQTTSPDGTWFATGEFFGNPVYFRIELKANGDKLTGVFESDKLEGSLQGNALRFHATDSAGTTSETTATLAPGKMTGTVVETDPSDKTHPTTYLFTAVPLPKRPAGPPKRYEFTPNVYYRQYSAANNPVLTVAPGDTIHTTTVDAGGVDDQGVRRSLGGNPETGPFYIESALPGDTLVVHINRLKLNRDYAVSDDQIVESGMNSYLAEVMKGVGKSIRWHLDLAKGVATPDPPSEHLKNYTVPLKPMLGCVATAPNPAQAAPGTGDSGNFGGNMDFNEVGEGATLYLAVNNPGALLYLGDGHAAQGDGELNGNALETSMDVEFTVDVIPGLPAGRRMETPTHVIAMGLSGSLDEAFKNATANMARWLATDYGLTPSEIAQVIGTAAEFTVSEVADRNSGIVLKISKERLQSLIRTSPK